jgi:hypothetical protein
MTDVDWDGLLEVVIAALAVSDLDILTEAQRITMDWEDKPDGLDWDDGLG